MGTDLCYDESMQKRKIIFIIFLQVLLLFFLFFFFQEKKEENVYIKIGENSFLFEVAETKEDRERGLSKRDALKEVDGLLFIFPTEDYHAIWMKEMNFPIDIIWIDKEKKVVDYKKNVPPESYPESFFPSMPAKYVLETEAGFIEKNFLTHGTTLSF